MEQIPVKKEVEKYLFRTYFTLIDALASLKIFF